MIWPEKDIQGTLSRSNQKKLNVGNSAVCTAWRKGYRYLGKMDRLARIPPKP